MLTWSRHSRQHREAPFTRHVVAKQAALRVCMHDMWAASRICWMTVTYVAPKLPTCCERRARQYARMQHTHRLYSAWGCNIEFKVYYICMDEGCPTGQHA